MSYLRCPRKLWLEQYSPDLEDEDALARADAESERLRERLEAISRHVAGERIPHERGLRAAVAATAELLARGGEAAIFDATFDHDGVTIQVDILERVQGQTRIVSVLPGAEVAERHLYDCAIRAWTAASAGCAVDRVAVALLDAAHADSPTGLTEVDVTEAVRPLEAEVPALVAQVRAKLAELDEPEQPTGPQCLAPSPCAFADYCGVAEQS